MLEKKLDNYYTKKVINGLRDRTLMYFLDIKFVKDKDGNVKMYVKKPKYYDIYYKCVFSMNIRDGLEYLINIDSLAKEVKNRIDEYVKEEESK